MLPTATFPHNFRITGLNEPDLWPGLKKMPNTADMNGPIEVDGSIHVLKISHVPK